MISPIKIEKIEAFELAGMKAVLRAAQPDPSSLWKRFMPQLKHLEPHRENDDLYALQQYPSPLKSLEFEPESRFECWAGTRIKSGSAPLPEGIKRLQVKGGLYAIFIHRGPASAFSHTLQAIYDQWLPGSGYKIDQRAHFQVMGPGYAGPNHPEAEEEIWIPVR